VTVLDSHAGKNGNSTIGLYVVDAKPQPLLRMVCGLEQLLQYAAYARPETLGILSIEDPNARRPERAMKLNSFYAEMRHFRVQFWDAQEDLTDAPARQHAEQIIGFLKLHQGRNMLIHCHRGVSRSPAAFLAQIYLDTENPLRTSREEAAAQKLVALLPNAAPNLRLLECFDQVLNTGDDGLVAAVLRQPRIVANLWAKFDAHTKWLNENRHSPILGQMGLRPCHVLLPHPALERAGRPRQ
jgi:predicted protein tyrosine phosphatase